MAFSSCIRLAAIHPNCCKQQTFRRPKPLLSLPTYVHAANLTTSLTGQKHRLQFLSPKTSQNPFTSSLTTSKSTICIAAAAIRENACSENSTTSPKIPATEICILLIVYIIPFLNRLNLLSKFPVLKYAVSPILPLIGFYRSIPTIGLIAFLALFIGFVRYRNSTEFKYSLVMDCVVVIASIIRPFLVNPVPLAGGALGFKFQLLNVLELLGFQTCIHSCLEYLGAVQWVGEEKEEKVNVASDVSRSSLDKLAHIMKVLLKTGGDKGRRKGKSVVLKLLKEHYSLFSDVNSSVACNKYILSSCESCLNSLLNLFKKAAARDYVGSEIALEVDNLLWLLDILEDRKAADEFALTWANQQELANLYRKSCWEPSCHLVSCITTRLFVGIGKGKILAGKHTVQLLLQTWFQPLVNDYSSLRKLKSFDPKVVEVNIGRTILKLRPEDQQSILSAWFKCFCMRGDACPDLRKAFEVWSRGSFGKTPPLYLSFQYYLKDGAEYLVRMVRIVLNFLLHPSSYFLDSFLDG